ncbi:hypothetical protein AA0112_g9863 [Alternaria arborescens]|uniref:hypothetical protein n=1 Tax=Alternaria arborescens TaxID=156630 RepID=UPI0010750647|nr:hypothetical protein AA0111_g7126 [Alternaria arborescens]RYN22590.1 hypothetical protein AA0112_g9863 [Alternaria arborescens]RYO27922.1 hypothetical protein AA0111_g7126 [Alternaria arborescens]
MKTFMIFSILAMALAVSAVPLDERDPTDTDPAPGGGSGRSGKCNGGQKQACCNTGLPDVLICNIQILGSTWNQEKYCCSTSAPVISIPFTLSRTPWSF